MKKLIILLLVIGALFAAGKAAQPKLTAWWKERNKPVYETVNVEKGDIAWHVQTTGKIEPVLKIQIGAFVSGPIDELNVDFNDKVEKGQVLAKVDPRLYDAAVARDTASLLRAKAQVAQVAARLQQATNDLKRAKQLQEINEGYISQSEMDQLCFSRQAQQAELKVAELQINLAQANLDNSELNLKYTIIDAPESGVIIDRLIDPGQTLQAGFTTPELFVLAPEMDKRMWVHANVVEADVGHIIQAQKDERPVTFYVDAYNDDLFKGKIIQVRQNPATEQNIVSYPVIVETGNEGMKLLPGMTANLSFEIDRREGVLKIPYSAISYVPDKKYVRDEDHDILEGKASDERDADSSAEVSAEKRVEATRRRRTRHVWVKDKEDKLRAIEIEFGISDGRFYELVKGELEEDQELVYSMKVGGK